MIVDINGVPHYFWRGKLYPGGVTPPPDPSDGAPRVIAERVGGGCDYLPDPDWVPTPARRGGYSGGYQGGYDDPIGFDGPPYRTMGGCETSHSPISSLSPEQHHLNMINHLKGLHGPRGC